MVLFLVTFVSAVYFLLDQLNIFLLILAIVVLGWLFFYHAFNEDSFLFYLLLLLPVLIDECLNFVYIEFV